MLTVPDFYAVARWRDRWGVLRADGTRHRGHDIACDTHEDIPALRGGTVTTNGWSSVLGNYVVLQRTPVTFDYYCHLLGTGRPSKGAVLADGGKVGAAAGANDDHGSAWSGVHLHYGSGPLPTSVTTGTTYDATAIITAVLTTAQPKEPLMAINAAWRQPSGTIWVQFEPGCPLYDGITLTEWSALSANGARYVDTTDVEVGRMKTMFGVSKEWPKLAPSVFGGAVTVAADPNVVAELQKISAALGNLPARMIAEQKLPGN